MERARAGLFGLRASPPGAPAGSSDAELETIREVVPHFPQRERVINAATPLPEKVALPANFDLECGTVSAASDSVHRIREHRECLMKKAEAEDELKQIERDKRLARARERGRRDGKLYMCGRLIRIPYFLLMARESLVFTLLGLTLGLGIDYLFCFIPLPPDNAAAFFGLYYFQLNVNALVIYAVLELYERIWARSPNMYLGYAAFISVFYKSQIRFALVGARLVESVYPIPLKDLG